MTVRELIAALRQYDPDAEVVVEGPEQDYSDVGGACALALKRQERNPGEHWRGQWADDWGADPDNAVCVVRAR